ASAPKTTTSEARPFHAIVPSSGTSALGLGNCSPSGRRSAAPPAPAGRWVTRKTSAAPARATAPRPRALARSPIATSMRAAAHVALAPRAELPIGGIPLVARTESVRFHGKRVETLHRRHPIFGCLRLGSVSPFSGGAERLAFASEACAVVGGIDVALAHHANRRREGKEFADEGCVAEGPVEPVADAEVGHALHLPGEGMVGVG